MAAYPPYNPYQYTPNVYGQQPMYQQPYQQYQTPAPTYQPQPQQTVPAQPNVNVRRVMSREEAVAAQIPFEATVNVFVNRSAGEVYVKSFNMQTGKADFEDYRYVSPQPVQQQSVSNQQTAMPEYTPITAFNGLVQRVDRLTEALSGIEDKSASARKTAAKATGKDE